MSSRKIKKSDTEKKDELDPTKDEFITTTASAFDWAYDHRRLLGLLIVLALLAAVGGIIGSRIMERRRAEESSLVSLGLEASFARVKPAEGEDPAAEEADPDALVFDDAKARAEEALKRWTQVVEGGEPRFRSLGELEKAATLMDLGKYAEAVKAYEAFLSAGAKGPAWLKAQASEGLGLALEAEGKIDEAEKAFAEWMSESDGDTKTLAAYHAARLAQKKGDKDAAVKRYKEVMAAYKDTAAPSRYDVVFVQARTRLLTLDPSAEVPALPAGGMDAFEGMDPRILQQLMQAQSGAGAS